MNSPAPITSIRPLTDRENFDPKFALYMVRHHIQACKIGIARIADKAWLFEERDLYEDFQKQLDDMLGDLKGVEANIEETV